MWMCRTKRVFVSKTDHENGKRRRMHGIKRAEHDAWKMKMEEGEDYSI